MALCRLASKLLTKAVGELPESFRSYAISNHKVDLIEEYRDEDKIFKGSAIYSDIFISSSTVYVQL